MKRIRGKSRVLRNDLNRPLRDSAQFNRSFGNVISELLQFLSHLVEQFVQTDEVWPFDVPMRLFGLEAKIENVGQLLVEQVNHRAADWLAQTVLCWVEFGFHIGIAELQCHQSGTGSAIHASVGICATPG